MRRWAGIGRVRLDDEEKPLTVDRPPELINKFMVKPEYHEDARKAGIQGKVILEVLIRKDGSVGKVKVMEGIEGYPSLAENAIEAVKQTKFKPATKDGKPVDMTIAIPIGFRLDSTKRSEAKTAE